MNTFSKILTSSTLTLAVSLTLCNQANAMPISKNGYSYSGSGNTFTGAGLEWLRWSETLNMTVNEAKKKYSEQGYRIATKVEGDNLIETMLPGISVGALYNGGEDAAIFDIVGGLTDLPVQDPIFNLSSIVAAGYGLDDDNDGNVSGFFYNALYKDNYLNPTPVPSFSGGTIFGYAALERSDSYVNVDTTKWPIAGVMLVRDLTTAVSEPASIALFSLGLASLGLVKRRKS